MPKDSHLLAPMSRALLRAARAGCTYVGPAPKGGGGGAGGAGGGAEQEREAAKSGEGSRYVPVYERTFVASKWGAIPRNAEPPETEFLAKRRPGLPSLHDVPVLASGSGGGLAEDAMGQQRLHQTQAAPMRKTKFRKTNPATGSALIYEVWVPSGYKVEDEVKEDDGMKLEDADSAVEVASLASGAIVEGVGVADQNGVVIIDQDASVLAPELNRNPPAPKRKAKGHGKGKRKKVMFAPGEGTPVPDAEEAEALSTQTAEEGGVAETEEHFSHSVPAAQEEQHGGETARDKADTETKRPEPEQVPQEETTVQPDIQDLSAAPEAPPVEPSENTDILMSRAEDQSPVSMQDNPQEPTSEEEQQSADVATGIPKAEETEDMDMDVDVDVDIQPSIQEQFEREAAPNPAGQEEHQTPTHDYSPVAEVHDTTPSPPSATATTSVPATTSETPAATAQATDTNPTEDQAAPEAEAEAPQPTTTAATTATIESESQQLHFDDGEVDLLGSLEASLDSRQTDRHHQQAETAGEEAEAPSQQTEETPAETIEEEPRAAAGGNE